MAVYSELDFVVGIPLLKAEFQRYLKREFSLENLDAFDDIRAYESKWSPNSNDKNKTAALAIFNKYFNGTASKHEVNVPSSLASAMLRQINSPPKNLFNDVESIIVVNLGDSYTRFKDESSELRKRQQELNVHKTNFESIHDPMVKLPTRQLEKVLTLSFVRTGFDAFLSERNARREIQLWDAIQQYKKSWTVLSPTNNAAMATKVYGEYLAPKRSTGRSQKGKHFPVLQEINGGQPHQNLFHHIEQETLATLGEQLSTWVITPSFNRWLLALMKNTSDFLTLSKILAK